MSIDNFLNQWVTAIDNDSFLTPKHDPNNTTIYRSFRTVLSPEMSGSLESLIKNKDSISTNHYHDENNKDYFVLATNNFDVVGFAVASGSSPDQSTPFDKLAIFSGSSQGWHCCAETSSFIQQKIEEGKLTLTGSYSY